MIKNIIFDFGNVIAQFYPEKLTSPFVSDEKTRKYISEVVFDRLYWDRLDDGTISDDEVKAQICQRVPEELCRVACTVYDNWICSMTPVEGIKDIVFALKESGKKLYLLSNISIGFAENYHKVPWIKEILDCFDGLVFSGVIGMVKPDRKIFEYLLDTFSLEADECLFIDDSAKNILGAESAGVKGYLFDGDASALSATLTNIGILR